jgi:hypothetical protein
VEIVRQCRIPFGMTGDGLLLLRMRGWEGMVGGGASSGGGLSGRSRHGAKIRIFGEFRRNG